MWTSKRLTAFVAAAAFGVLAMSAAAPSARPLTVGSLP